MQWFSHEFSSFVGQVVALTSSELLTKIFFFKFCRSSCGTHLKELLAKMFLFNLESCPLNNISVIILFHVLSAKLWHSPQVSCWPRFFVQF